MTHMKTIWIILLIVGTLLCCGIGTAEKPTKEPVDKLVMIHYKEKTGPKGFTPTDQAPLHKLLGVKWTTFPINYSVNSDGLYSAGPELDPLVVENEINASFKTWDDETGTQLFQYNGTTSNTIWDETDGLNVIFWGPMENPDIISTTNIWYYRYSKMIVETDIKMNSNQPWGIDPDDEGPGTIRQFDIRNIITHEAGHVCGLDDLYNKPASELTMYGYSSLGEVKKDSLGIGDIMGLRRLYG